MLNIKIQNKSWSFSSCLIGVPNFLKVSYSSKYLMLFITYASISTYFSNFSLLSPCTPFSSPIKEPSMSKMVYDLLWSKDNFEALFATATTLDLRWFKNLRYVFLMSFCGMSGSSKPCKFDLWVYSGEGWFSMSSYAGKLGRIILGETFAYLHITSLGTVWSPVTNRRLLQSLTPTH